MINKSTEASIITSYFNSGVYVKDSMDKIFKFCDFYYKKKFEIIYVNDGSTDNTLIELKKLANLKKPFYSNCVIKIIDMRKNFGQAGAYITGMLQSTGKRIIILEGDFVKEQEINLNNFYKKYLTFEKKGTDLLILDKIFISRSIVDTIFSFLFWKIYFFTSGIKLKQNICWTRIFDRKILNEVIKYDSLEFNANKIFLKKSKSFKVLNVKKKFKGYSNYTFFKKLKLAITLIFYSFIRLRKININFQKKKYMKRIQSLVKI
jgi:glycosyltransferase involved in cell wall biosynthesis